MHVPSALYSYTALTHTHTHVHVLAIVIIHSNDTGGGYPVARRVSVHTRKGMSRHKLISTLGRGGRARVFFARKHKFIYCFRLTRRDAAAAAAAAGSEPGVLYFRL